VFARFAVVGFLIFAGADALCADQITFYTNHVDWDEAESVGTVNGPVTVNADPSFWTQTMGLYGGNPVNEELNEITTLSKGATFAFSSVGEYFPLDSIQFVDGSIGTGLSSSESVTWTLSQPIYGFGAYFATNVPPGLIGGNAGVQGFNASIQNGFLGASSDVPIDPLIFITAAEWPGRGGDLRQ
jgi:hypothetical protein